MNLAEMNDHAYLKRQENYHQNLVYKLFLIPSVQPFKGILNHQNNEKTDWGLPLDNLNKIQFTCTKIAKNNTVRIEHRNYLDNSRF